MTDQPGAELICQQNFYHQRPGRNPNVLGNGTFSFVRLLKSSSPSFVVEGVEVDSKWMSVPIPSNLKAGDVGTVIVRNLEGQFHETLPSEEQIRETQQRVLEVSFAEFDRPVMYVPPGEQLPINPTNGTVIKVRSRVGTVMASFMVVPR